MILIFLAAIVAALLFRREAYKRGYETSQVTRYPLLVGGILGIVAGIAGLLMKVILSAVSQPASFQNVMQRVVEVFFLVIFLAIAWKSWKAIKQLPPKPKSGAE